MKKLIWKIGDPEDYQHRHKDDVERLQRVLLANGYYSELQSCADIWQNYSDDYEAGWMGMPNDDDELWGIVEWRVSEAASKA